MNPRYFDDFSPGDRFVSAGKTMTEGEIVAFAFTYDPQPIHLDREAAEASPYGGLIASGFQTMAVGFRLAWQTNLFSACSLGSPGLDEVRWLKPVRPGDTLRTVIEIVELRPSASKPDRGVARIRYSVIDQIDEAVMTMIAVQILARRPAPTEKSG